MAGSTPPPGWGPPPSHPPPAYPPPAYPPFGPPPSPGPRGKGLAVLLGVLGAVLVLALAVVVPLVVTRDDEGATGGGGSEEVDTSDLSAVELYDDLPTTHTDDPVDYEQSPPVGGEHAPVWLDCGVYDEPVPVENVVHDLEHGTVWITYDPALDSDDVQVLEDVLPQNGILSPYDDLRAPVVMTVWGVQLELTGVEDPRIEMFLDEYSGGDTAPEPYASCAGGLRDPSSGERRDA